MTTTSLGSPETACLHKVTYRTRAYAKKVAKRMQPKVGRVEAYRCRHCGHFHVGHSPKPLTP